MFPLNFRICGERNESPFRKSKRESYLMGIAESLKSTALDFLLALWPDLSEVNYMPPSVSAK